MDSWLKIGFWNINGLSGDQAFKREMIKYGINFCVRHGYTEKT